jgi:hypothetical protein
VFRRLSKLLNQEDAWAHPVLCGDFCSPPVRPRGAQECCGKAYSFILMSLYGSLHPSHHADKR